jgi:hypothetical protein
VTPIEKAEQLLKLVVAEAGSYKLPKLQYAQIGSPVIAEEVVTVSCTGMSIMPNYDPTCGPIQQGNFVVIIARD